MRLDAPPSLRQRGRSRPIDEDEYLGLFCPLLMRWTAPATGIAMCQSAVAVVDRRESPFGYKCAYEAAQTWSVVTPTPGVNAESAVIGVQLTRIGIGDEGDCCRVGPGNFTPSPSQNRT